MEEPLIAIFSVLVLFFVSLFAFSGCQKTHTHEFGEWTIVKQATCEENGTKSVSVRDATKPNKKRLRLSGAFNDNGVFYITVVEITEDGSETEYVVEVYEWTKKNGVVTLYSNGQLADSGKIVAGCLVPDDMIS